MENIDLYGIPSSSIENANTGELIRFAKSAADKGTVAVFVFHEIGKSRFNISREAHDSLLQYLDGNRDIYWTDTFKNVAQNLGKKLSG